MNYLLLFDVYRLGVRRENIACVANGRWERWRVDSLLGRSKIDGYSNGRDVDRLWTIRYCYLLLIIGAGCAEIPVFLEVRLIVALDLADGLDRLESLLTLLGVFRLVEAVYLVGDLLALDLTLPVYLYLEELHPTRTLLRVFCEHSCDQVLQERRNRPRKLKFTAIEHFNQIRYRIGLKGANPKDHFKEHYSHRPNISLIGINLPFEHFRRHIDRRAKHGLGHLIRRIQIFAEPEIS